MTYGSKLMFVETRPRTGRVARLPRHNRAVTRAPGCSPMSNHKRQNVAFGSCPCQKLLSSVAEMSMLLIQPKTAWIDPEAIRQCPTGFGFRYRTWSRKHNTTQQRREMESLNRYFCDQGVPLVHRFTIPASFLAYQKPNTLALPFLGAPTEPMSYPMDERPGQHRSLGTYDSTLPRLFAKLLVLPCLRVNSLCLGCASAFPPLYAQPKGYLLQRASSLPSGSEEESTAAASPLHGYLSPRYLVEPGAPLQWQPGSPGRPPQRPASTGVKVPLRCKPQPPSSI
ncbi:unnamed protein product [Fusarium venenatum]|uniref:Uncharacterized protein n=1 Tax=Fusarium venenatum TaxID=56646 RepID=A0A2L2TSY7_9HYPO|nr:uncharacterized protein FVRRES_03538 [Fusarium venenatum]CEI67026.1 unnamed protein product [Fusarium venenatum]